MIFSGKYLILSICVIYLQHRSRKMARVNGSSVRKSYPSRPGLGSWEMEILKLREEGEGKLHDPTPISFSLICLP
jgi:hypothetical protein